MATAQINMYTDGSALGNPGPGQYRLAQAASEGGPATVRAGVQRRPAAPLRQKPDVAESE